MLPFENLSEDKANVYFADGIQEEILTRLSRVADLKVISRTSTQRYKNTAEPMAEIAKQLGVANILEGSVRKAANRVRVHVQLIDAENDAHLWAERYDRELDDIFAVESDIAANIAEALQARLSGAERRAISVQPTTNVKAHELYLKGRHFWRNFFAPATKKSAIIFDRQSNSTHRTRRLTRVSVFTIHSGRATASCRQTFGQRPKVLSTKRWSWMRRWGKRLTPARGSSFIIKGTGPQPKALFIAARN